MDILQMLKHGRAGVPMEVMGLMLGEFVDEYTVQVIDVFAMPQSGTTVTVESVDHVFQTKMLEMLKQTGRWQQLIPNLKRIPRLTLYSQTSDLKWLLDGIIHTLVLAAGFPVLISIRNRWASLLGILHCFRISVALPSSLSSRLIPARSLWLLIQYNPSRVKLLSMLSALSIPTPLFLVGNPGRQRPISATSINLQYKR